MVRGEEKQFEATIDRLIDYTKNIKISLVYFIQKIETEGERIDWPQVLDSFTSICGQINTLMRFARENRSQFIENRVVLPLLLTPDRDEELLSLTENRVHMVNHEMVPDYLRTKPDPEIEEVDKALQKKADLISPDAAVKQVNSMNRLVDSIGSLIKTSSAKSDMEISRQAMKASFDTADTNALILAVSTGRGLAPGLVPHRPTPMESTSMMPKIDVVRQPAMQKQNVKAPELKTNIKAGP